MPAAYERSRRRRTPSCRLTFAAGLASLLPFASPTAAKPRKVDVEAVVVKTPDGMAEAALAHPKGPGRWPAILLWPDIVGLRPQFRELAGRFAAEGFVVLVPNSFYRSMRPSDAELDAHDPGVRPVLMGYRAALSDDGVARDAAAYVAFLDARPETNSQKKAVTIGYDLGGSYAFRTAAALPERVGGVGSIYGLGVATAKPNSPHLFVRRSKATYYIASSRDDDAREPDDKADLREAIQTAGLRGVVEVYPADHDWANPAAKTYDVAAAQRAFDALVKLSRDVSR